MGDEEIQRAVKLIDRMVSGLGFLPMSWEEVFKDDLVADIKSFMRDHTDPDSLWQGDEEDDEV